MVFLHIHVKVPLILTSAQSRYTFALQMHREVSERLKEHAWNACVGQLTEGSNPFLSAIIFLLQYNTFVL